MFALSYICRTCPQTMLEPYVGFKVVRRSKWRTLSDDQCVIQGNIRRMVIWEFSLLQLCIEEYNWVDICVYLQYIIIMKEEGMIQGWSSQSAKMGFELINSQSIHNVSIGILWSQMPGRSWAGDFASRAEDSGHPKTGSNTNTKMTKTWASGLLFWWSWARWNHNNELYKYMHRNIIVQQGRIKQNDERFDLSIRDESAKPSTSKTQ
jgi:hypothetical protein